MFILFLILWLRERKRRKELELSQKEIVQVEVEKRVEVPVEVEVLQEIVKEVPVVDHVQVDLLRAELERLQQELALAKKRYHFRDRLEKYLRADEMLREVGA